uniref:Actinlike protein ARP6 putative n=1 Tax=Albugo laibachii Nc14 TaxID=890382 RepID=F0WRH9_9STRA|nr:actinlike protein ARP6 putative [Albugo laibachii Nc14]|eukprot:CCA23942.1 actinlike protein ARP6 putative [Albugo laibachii Nc14]
MKVIAIDNGGHTIKASVVPTDGFDQNTSVMETYKPLLLKNQAALSSDGSKLWIGEQLFTKERQREKLTHLRPIERGYCVNWNIESEIWSHLFSSQMLNVPIAPGNEIGCVCTAPLFSPKKIVETMDQVVFEEFGFDSLCRVPSAAMCVESQAHSAEKPSQGYLVVDTGFSFTHVIPVINGEVNYSGVKRLNVGGKLLTNYLKEIITTRQYNVSREYTLMEELKESQCYCANSFQSEMQQFRNSTSLDKNWLLPNFISNFHGRELDPAQLTSSTQYISLGLEMIRVPEILFYPSDIGIDQSGIASVIVQSVNECPLEVQPLLYQNILIVGGNSKFPNFRERLVSELRPIISTHYPIHFCSIRDPILTAWEGCVLKANRYETCSKVTREHYLEHGTGF